MLFSRKNPAKLSESARVAIWPRGGIRRGWLYVWHRLKRLKNHPHAVALGFAIGVFVSFTPFLGLHLAMCVLLSVLLRGSILASLIGQVIGNPVTLPFIYLATWRAGALFVPAAHDFSLQALNFSYLIGHWQVLLLPLCVGGIVLGLPVAAASYFLILALLRLRRSSLPQA